MLPETLYKCLENDCIVAVATADVDGHPHLVNTWNKYVMVTKDDELLIPCAGYRKTESNIKSNPYVEITIGSTEVKGKKYLGTGFLLPGTAEFQSDGPLFERMHSVRKFCNRVMVFTPETCKQMV